MTYPEEDLNGWAGFVFDPDDSGAFDTHINELDYLKSYQWVDTTGKTVDMRKIDLRYLMNIYQWMFRFGYEDTRQFKFLAKRIRNQVRKHEIAKKILSRPMGWSKL